VVKHLALVVAQLVVLVMMQVGRGMERMVKVRQDLQGWVMVMVMV
jgi:hypothetical protein